MSIYSKNGFIEIQDKEEFIIETSTKKNVKEQHVSTKRNQKKVLKEISSESNTNKQRRRIKNYNKIKKKKKKI